MVLGNSRVSSLLALNDGGMDKIWGVHITTDTPAQHDSASTDSPTDRSEKEIP